MSGGRSSQRKPTFFAGVDLVVQAVEVLQNRGALLGIVLAHQFSFIARRGLGGGPVLLSRNGETQQAAIQILRARAAGLPDGPADDQISFSNLSLHELFERQTLDLLERADIDEEQRQSILIAMSCPCCGAGGMSYTVKLKR